MVIKKIEQVVQIPEMATTYKEEVYIDAVTDDSKDVKVLDKRRSRIVTVSQLETERDSAQAEADSAQSKLDEIEVLETD